MKHFPIFSQGVCLGVLMVMKFAGTWRVQYLRDDRFGPVFTLAELAQFITSGDPKHAMMLAKIGYVVADIENYTSCPLRSIPRSKQNYGLTIEEENIRNPFLRYVRHNDSPWMADFMLPWYVNGYIQFENVPKHNTMLFQIAEDQWDNNHPTVKIKGDSNIVYSSFCGHDTTLTNVQATFCQFNGAAVKNQSMHNGYIFGEGEDLRVCL